MKIDTKSLLTGVLIGLVIGGFTIGILDAKRPKPLFSSANYGGSCEVEEAAVSNLADIIKEVGKQPGDNTASLAIYAETMNSYQAALKSCKALEKLFPNPTPILE